ncbi:MAG: Transcriptional regulator, LysR family [Burkholderiaceae bacterium]|jgi:DNA-binding transcriptional LysR family regulator|nr:MAG: Transcriptional regulator, LysR family [Burkholderiaceae bacterium]
MHSNGQSFKMQKPRDVLTPDTFAMLQAIASNGSFAQAAQALGLVPSTLTYRVRQVEDALDALLFDRSARRARPTEAGRELLREGARLLGEIDAVANRVRRVATGWEPQLTLSVDSAIADRTVLELCEAFLALDPPTALKLREEALSGTLQALVAGQADLAIGVVLDAQTHPGIHSKPLGQMRFVFAVAPHHPLAHASEPLADELIRRHRAVAVADSVAGGAGLTFGLLAGQPVLTVPTIQAKLHAQLRGLGAGFLPEPLARPYVEAGHLVVRQIERPARVARLSYAWCTAPAARPGRALQWWLQQLESPATRGALLERQYPSPV